jgi:hypothetical protein
MREDVHGATLRCMSLMSQTGGADWLAQKIVVDVRSLAFLRHFDWASHRARQRTFRPAFHML